MTIRLTEQQWADISHEADKSLVRMSDPAERISFVLVPAELYERLKPLFEDDPVTDHERLAHLEQFARRAGWDDPAMDVYDDLDPRRQT